MRVRPTKILRRARKRWGVEGLDVTGLDVAHKICIVSCKFLLLFSFLFSAGCLRDPQGVSNSADTEQERLNDRWQGFWLGNPSVTGPALLLKWTKSAAGPADSFTHGTIGAGMTSRLYGLSCRARSQPP